MLNNLTTEQLEQLLDEGKIREFDIYTAIVEKLNECLKLTQN